MQTQEEKAALSAKLESLKAMVAQVGRCGPLRATARGAASAGLRRAPRARACAPARAGLPCDPPGHPASLP